MEDVAAVKVTDRVRGDYAFLTWGRAFDRVDPTDLIAAITRLLPTMGFEHATQISVCYDLGEVADYRYFFEGLLSFAAKMASEPYQSEEWLRAQVDGEALRRAVFLIGPPRPETHETAGRAREK